MEPDPAIFSNQPEFLVMGLGQQLNHKIFDLQIDLTVEYAEALMAHTFSEWSTKDWSN